MQRLFLPMKSNPLATLVSLAGSFFRPCGGRSSRGFRCPSIFGKWLLIVLAGHSGFAAPPFSGTIFIDPDIITASDPTTFISAPYAGQGLRLMFDRRVNNWVTLNVYLFNATFSDGLTSEIQVNPEFGTSALAGVEATKYGTVIGRLPTVLRSNVQTVVIHKGTEPFGGGNNGLLIHTGQGDLYAADGILEETLVHEAAHASLDGPHAAAPGWLAAQAADPEFISTYARDNPTREDIAESYLPWLAVRYRQNRITPALANTIIAAIPNRLAYFDQRNFDLYPIDPIVQEIAVFTGASTSAANERADNIGTHEFGNIQVGSASAAQTFTIKNMGAANLTGLALSKGGANPGDFTPGALGATTLAPRATTTFTVTFSPTASGVRSAVVNIASNDANENPFRINVRGIGIPVVTNVNDSGPGSLRQAVADVAAVSGAVITFAPALSGQTITLASDLLVSTGGATVDASSLAAGLTIDGGAGTNRIFTVDAGKTFTLIGATLTGGNGTGNLAGDSGGAIYNRGTLTLDRCTFTGNSSTSVGGAIYNSGTTTMTRCSLANNSSNFGGAIANYGNATLTHCTISGNTASANGGGIDNGNGTTIVLTLANSIVAGNFAGTDLYNFNGTVTRIGASIVVNYAGVAATGAGTISSASPLLAPLGNHGGTTNTMALKPGSPARNASVGSTITSDQRGFPLVGTADIGAYEAGTLTSFNAFIWESLPATATNAQHATTVDFDGDGVTNLNEWLALTNPADRTSSLRVTQLTRTSPHVTVTFPSVAGRSYTFESTPDLVAWTPIAGAPVPGTGSNLVIQLGPFPGATRLFIKVRTGP
jgi:predicted outer membrane repeat protein